MNTHPDVVIDVRNASEYADGHLENAVLIPHTEITGKIAAVVPDKKSSIALYCRSGRRAGLAQDALKKLGYENVDNFGGMEDAAKALNKPIVK